MGRIKVYTDEDVDMAVGKALKLRGFEASTTLEEGKSASSDEEQLKYATSIGAVLLTHNVQDFPKIHYEFMRHGKHHRGIIVAKQVSVGEIIKSFLYLASTLSAEDVENRLEYLSNW
jgi:predicted nuclease of predicted toxin-antitoxin system